MKDRLDWFGAGLIAAATALSLVTIGLIVWLMVADHPSPRERCESYCRDNGGACLSFDALGEYTCAPVTNE